MDARIILSRKTRNQKSQKGMILEFMQNHPKLCRNTNIRNMAKAMLLDKDSDIGTQLAIETATRKMVESQMISRFGGKRRANFFINYLHKDIPPYILENMPDEMRITRSVLEKGLKENQKLDEVGCVVTEKEQETKEEIPEEKEEVTIIEPEQPEIVSSDASKENNVVVPVEVTKTPTGQNISITINLNIH